MLRAGEHRPCNNNRFNENSPHQARGEFQYNLADPTRMEIELLWRADRHFSDLMEKYMQLPFPVACGFRITRFPYIRIKRQIGL